MDNNETAARQDRHSTNLQQYSNTAVNQLPVIAGVEITIDAEDRRNLNALHKASGLSGHKRPSKWLSLDTTKELIVEFESQSPSEGFGNSAISTIKGGRNSGTFAVEQLAVAYANWISAAFYLQVINTFLAYKKGNLQPVIPQTYAQAMRIAADQAEENERLALQNTQQSQKIHYLENLFQSGETIAAFGKLLNGVHCGQLNEYCAKELSWLYDESRSGTSKQWRVLSYARDKYLTETSKTIIPRTGSSFTRHEPKLLQCGAKKLYQLYLDNRLPMKKTWDGKFSHFKFSEAGI